MRLATLLGACLATPDPGFGQGNAPDVQCSMMRRGDFYENLDDLAKKMTERDLGLRYVTSREGVSTLAFIPNELNLPSSWYKFGTDVDYYKKLKEVNRNTQNRANLWRVSFNIDIFLYTPERVQGKVGFARVEDGIIKGIT